MTETIKKDDYARLHFAYHEDTDLAIIADELDEQHEAGYLIWLYWPRIIARAKQAKTFGWFSATPRNLAASLHDKVSGDAWNARQLMWWLLAEHDLVRVRQGLVEAPSAKIDVLVVEYEKWQSLSNAEHSKLRRERLRVADGAEVHWTMRHWSDFTFAQVGASVTDTDLVSVSVTDTDSVSRPTEQVSHGAVATLGDRTLNETRQDETKEGARGARPLPTSVMDTITMVREIPGVSPWQLESNVRKAMAQFPSLPDESICEAITAFEAVVPEGATLHASTAWRKLRNCFEVARQKLDEAAAQTASGGGRFGRVDAGSDEWRRRSIASLGKPVTT
jgi:hypothetical protein